MLWWLKSSGGRSEVALFSLSYITTVSLEGGEWRRRRGSAVDGVAEHSIASGGHSVGCRHGAGGNGFSLPF